MKFVKENPTKWKLRTRKLSKGTYYADYMYESYWDGKEERELKETDNFVFDAVLKPDTFYRGRSAAGFIFKAEDGSALTMRIAKVEELLQAVVEGKVKVTKGGFKGRYTFFKQGSNYSIGLYNE